MKMNLFKLTVVFLLTAVILPKEGLAQQSDSLTLVTKNYDRIMKHTDHDTMLKKLTRLIPLSGTPSKKIAVSVYAANGIARRLVFNSYDESMSVGGRQLYYFDSTGKAWAHVNEMKGASANCDVYALPSVIVYTRNDPKSLVPQVLEYGVGGYILATEKYEMDYYMSNFPDILYSTFSLPNDTAGYVLKLAKNMELHAAPGFASPLVRKLTAGAPLYYVDRSPQQDSLPGQGKWVWYKVKDQSKHEGWIWGSPYGMVPFY